MRKWSIEPGGVTDTGQALAGMITRLGLPHFENELLDGLYPLLPAASWSVYRTGKSCRPAMFMSASHGIPDTTRDCWRAYLSGPYLSDRTLVREPAAHVQASTVLCHITAQEIAADNDLRVKKLALDTLAGKTDAQPKGLVVPTALPPVVPQDVNAWVDQSTLIHPSIRQAQKGLEIAELEVNKAEAGHKPTLDVNASYNANRSPSGSAQSALGTRNNTATIGLAFNLPLFAGFATQNRIRETLSLRDKAQNDLEGARRSVALATRTAFFGVQSGQGQVKALEAAELSSQSALDANKLGYQVGVRINIDVLNSQSQLFQTKRDLAQARYNVLLGGLRLRQANGSLSPTDLLIINSLLAR